MEDLTSLSVGQVLEKSAAVSPDKIAVVDGERRITYEDLNATANSLAAGLDEIGFKKGDRAGIYMKNSVELVRPFMRCKSWVSSWYG